MRIKNVAKDHAQVGQQIGMVKGSVYYSSGRSSTDGDPLAAQLADLKNSVEEARRDGMIDSDSANAVAEEIDKAAESLPLDDEDSSGRFVLAMKRAKGLTEGIADLTVKISAAIAAASGIM